MNSAAGLQRLSQMLAESDLLSPPRVVVPRLAWRERVTMLAAREKAGKSTIAAAAAAALSTGRPFLGQATSAGIVAWMALEGNPADLARNLDRFETDPDAVYVALSSTPWGLLRDQIVTLKPDLIVVDTLASFADGRVSDARESTGWTPLMNDLGRLAQEAHAAVILIHHGRKSDNTYRDSTAIGAGVDVIIEMKVSTEADIRHLASKGRFEVEAFAVRLVGDEFELVADSLPVSDRLVAVLRAQGPCNLGHLRQSVGGRAGLVDDAIDQLLRAGIITDFGSPGNHQYAVTK